MEAVREAERSDADRCAALSSRAVQELNGSRGGSLLVRKETGLVAKALMRPGGLRRLIEDPKRKVVLGTVDGHVVGLGVGRVDEVGEGSLGVVDVLYVESDARGIGVGAALLEALLSWFSAGGCLGVDAPVLPGDRASKSFFEGAGMKARLITMHRSL